MSAPEDSRRIPKSAGLIEAVLAFVAGTVLSSIGLQVASSATNYHAGSGGDIPLAVTVFGLVGLWIGLVGGAVFYSRLWGSGDVRADLGVRLGWWDLPVGAVAGLASQYLLIPLLYLPFEHHDPTLKHRLGGPARSETAAVHGTWQIVVLVLFIAVLAPIVEELFFRGLLLRSLNRAFGPIVGITGSALAFGLAHFEALQLAGLVLFGLVLAGLAYRTNRLGPGIVAHAVFNGATVITLVHH